MNTAQRVTLLLGAFLIALFQAVRIISDGFDVDLTLLVAVFMAALLTSLGLWKLEVSERTSRLLKKRVLKPFRAEFSLISRRTFLGPSWSTPMFVTR